MRNSTTIKMRVLITTVDPSQRLIHAMTPDGPMTVSVIEVGAGFTWPREGEYWSVYKENQTWILGGRLQQNTDQRKIEELLPGQSLAPSYYEERLAAGTLYSVIEHSLGSKALSHRVRSAQTGYTVSLATSITSGLTSALVAKELFPSEDGVRHTGSGFMMIDNEILRYASCVIGETTTTFSTLSRGQLGTQAVGHDQGSLGTLFSFVGSASVPVYEISPIDNNRSLIKFATATTFPVDLALLA